MKAHLVAVSANEGALVHWVTLCRAATMATTSPIIVVTATPSFLGLLMIRSSNAHLHQDFPGAPLRTNANLAHEACADGATKAAAVIDKARMP